MKKYLAITLIAFSATACSLEAGLAEPTLTAGEPGLTSEVTASSTAAPTATLEATVTDLPGREAFLALNDSSAPWWSGTLSTVRGSIASGEAWSQDPEQIALRLGGYQPDSPPEFQPVAVEIVRTEQQASYLVTQEPMQDDSVRGQQLWIDLAWNGSQWDVVWAGARWKCQPGRGSQDWAPELCV